MENQSDSKPQSSGRARNGDNLNSNSFETYLPWLLEERDRCGVTEMIGEIEALMITVEPGNSIEHVAELALMSPGHYLVTLDSPGHFTHILRIDMNSPDILPHEVKNSDHHDIFRSLNDPHPKENIEFVVDAIASQGKGLFMRDNVARVTAATGSAESVSQL